MTSQADVIETILGNASFQTEVQRVAAQLQMEPAKAAQGVRACLREMVAVQRPWAVRLYERLMRPLHAHAWKVQADAAAFDKLAQLNRQHALVFLPSHRSYADPLVLGAALRAHGFAPNFTLPGANMGFWPLGALLRRVGGITIRRSFRDDALYKLALREYFGHLAAARTNLEWYIEGGRSRTGKLRPPRYGLLGYLVDAIRARRAEDVLLVPVSMTYDQLAEVRSMAAEEQGASKLAEGPRWFWRYLRQQRRHVGSVHLRFGEPLLLSQALAWGDAGAANPRLVVERTAFELCDRINNATPVLANALVTLALLGVGGRALTLPQVLALLTPLLDYCQQRGLPLIGAEALRTGDGAQAVLLALQRAGVVSCHAAGTEPVYSIQAGQHNVAAFYRNSAVHWFVGRAIVELAFLQVAQHPGTDPVDTAWQEALRLRDLLKFEFFFARKQVFATQLVAELSLIDPDWQAHAATPEDAHALFARCGFLLAHRVLRSFIESYLVVADLLVAEDPLRAVEPAALLARCVGVGQQYRLQGRLVDPEAVSREGFGNGLALAGNLGLLGPEATPQASPATASTASTASTPATLLARRQAWRAQLEDVLARIAAIDAIENHRSGAAHAHA
ncbi:MAG: 1-acyl-sn-glycerol-3-phosphate acyltransferase [Ideonella sp.]|nr:1-acyl-sn-glycerol-3-phosphate acyltransferase [Ideonella sp.]